MAILSVGLEKLSHFALAPTASRTSALSGTAVDLNDYEGDICVILDVENGGTSTLDVKIQSADTSGGTYSDVTDAAFTQVSTSASKQTLVLTKGAPSVLSKLFRQSLLQPTPIASMLLVL